MGGTRTSLYNDRNSPVEKGRMKRIIEMKSLNRVEKRGCGQVEVLVSQEQAPLFPHKQKEDRSCRTR